MSCALVKPCCTRKRQTVSLILKMFMLTDMMQAEMAEFQNKVSPTAVKKKKTYRTANRTASVPPPSPPQSANILSRRLGERRDIFSRGEFKDEPNRSKANLTVIILEI